MLELLVEIGTEEIPARFIEPAIAYLRENIPKFFEDLRLNFSELKIFATPRRLVFFAKVDEKQAEIETVKVGPPKDKAFTPDGKPTPAGAGFAKSQGVKVEELIIISQKKGDFVAAKKLQSGRAAREVLAESLPAFILSIPFPKTMRWSDEKIRFARPIHWICALLGSEVLNFSLGSVKSDAKSCGHRFLAPKPFRVKGLGQLESELKKRFVILDQNKRKKALMAAAKKLADKEKAELVLTDELLSELNYLVEYPVIYEGAFDPAFLELPEEVLITVMHHHQRYIPLKNPQKGLLNRFLFISATPVKKPKKVIEGNERVLKARLTDAKFFFDSDCKKKLSELSKKLGGVTFLEGLGSYADKIKRVEQIAERFSHLVAPDKAEMIKVAANICKSDLLTEMVGEFPELQGVMGRIYALNEGYDSEIALAIEDHYKPRGAEDELPKTDIGAILSISEKFDNLASCFALGLTPSGTKDPYALRRQALGLIRILLDLKYELRLSKSVQIALETLKQFHPNINISRNLEAEILEFIRARMLYFFMNKGYAQDVVEAVLSADFDVLHDVHKRIEAVSKFKSHKNFDDLAVSFKRVVNIIPDGYIAESVNTGLFQMETEKKLWEQYNETAKKVTPIKLAQEYGKVLEIIPELKPHIDKFFDDVLVMTEEEALRKNRLNLLCSVASLYSTIADFKKLGGIAEKQGQGGNNE